MSDSLDVSFRMLDRVKEKYVKTHATQEHRKGFSYMIGNTVIYFCEMQPTESDFERLIEWIKSLKDEFKI